MIASAAGQRARTLHETLPRRGLFARAPQRQLLDAAYRLI